MEKLLILMICFWRNVRLFFLLIFLYKATYAQVDNSLLCKQNYFSTDRTGSLYLTIYNLNYQRNYEYFNRFADGLTYYGFALQPELVYHTSDHVSLSGGLQLRKDFGRSGFYDQQPLFSVNIHKNNFQFISGSLNGNIAHQLLEPLYDYDRVIYDPLEYGTQFLYNDSSFFLDAWINWENMIYKPASEQERLSGGISVNYHLPTKSKFELAFPLQMLAYHKGGQIDTLDVPLTTIVNTALGAKITYNINAKYGAYTENYYLTYKDFSFTKQNPYAQGNGLLLNAGVKLNTTNLIFTYWRGNGYQSIHGAPVYQSVSSQINNEGYKEDLREFLFIRLVSEYKIAKNLLLGMRLEPYIDLNHTKFEFSNSLFLVYREDFFLKRIK